MSGRIRFKARARATRRSPGEMNGLERKYAEHLEHLKDIGEVADWKFDRIKLRIAKLCYITVDFAVVMADGTLEFHETKGFMEGDALIKLKAVAEEFWWFRFVLVKAIPKKAGGGFEAKEIGA